MCFRRQNFNVIRKWVQSESSTRSDTRQMIPVQSTSLLECDGQWWAYCCLSCWFTSLAGCCLNRRLKGGALCTSICFGSLGLVLFISVAICAVTLLLGWDAINDDSDKIVWMLICFIAICVFLIALFILKIMLCRQRCHFLRNQRHHLAIPNDEGCCETCCIVLFCFPCNHGQIASATIKYIDNEIWNKAFIAHWPWIVTRINMVYERW